jgi:hypothetical protein
MAAETWLPAQEAVDLGLADRVEKDLGLADRVEKPVQMAAHFDLSPFRNAPPQLAATFTNSTPQENEMADLLR